MKPELKQKIMLTYLGKPYIWAGSNPTVGLDCSGLVLELLQNFGLVIKQDMTAQGIYDWCKQLVYYEHETNVGSLVFYGKSITEIKHVAMVFDKEIIIEARGGGPTTTSVEAAIKQNAFITLRSMYHRADLVDILTLASLDG